MLVEERKYAKIIQKPFWRDEAYFKLSGAVIRTHCVYYCFDNSQIKLEEQHNQPVVTVWKENSCKNFIGPVIFYGTIYRHA